jgi:hypothetical protein
LTEQRAKVGVDLRLNLFEEWLKDALVERGSGANEKRLSPPSWRLSSALQGNIAGSFQGVEHSFGDVTLSKFSTIEFL